MEKIQGEPFWVSRARKEIGIAEDDGPGSNPRIIEYNSCTKLAAKDDSFAWCSSFMCWVFEQEGIPSTKSAAAASWLNWGVPILKPILGCLVIIKREGAPNAAHVAFYLGEEPGGKFILLGGNQQNRVCVMTFSNPEVLGLRMPDPKYWHYENPGNPIDA